MSTEKRMSKPKPVKGWASITDRGRVRHVDLYRHRALFYCDVRRHERVIPVLITPLESGEKK